MKKILAVALMLVVMFVCGNVAQAAHSTQENFNYCFKICISAINDTEDYANLITNGDYDVAVIRRRDCDSLEENLGFFSSNGSAQGAESLTLMLESRIILQNVI